MQWRCMHAQDHLSGHEDRLVARSPSSDQLRARTTMARVGLDHPSLQPPRTCWSLCCCVHEVPSFVHCSQGAIRRCRCCSVPKHNDESADDKNIANPKDIACEDVQASNTTVRGGLVLLSSWLVVYSLFLLSI
jgi:hypothetical protein